MTGPRIHHVEARASHAPARQYVSETHDHKPDAKGDGWRAYPVRGYWCHACPDCKEARE